MIVLKKENVQKYMGENNILLVEKLHSKASELLAAEMAEGDSVNIVNRS